MKIKIAAVTNNGKERENNEDAHIMCPDLLQQNWSLEETPTYISLGEFGSLLVVADGMGGANAGEVASSIAIKSIQKTFCKVNIENALKEGKLVELIQLSVKEANDAINQRIWYDPYTSGMGTTVVICWIIGKTAYVAWCGDSRCYVYNPFEGLIQLTKDHSLVQELIDKGEITEEEALTHPDNNIITRGLGDMESESKPDIITCHISTNDIILLCSDGLCGYSTNKEIERVLDANCIDLIKCRNSLLNLALDAGGQDNICISLASMIDDEQSQPAVPNALQRIWIMIKRVFCHPKRV